MLTYIQFSNAEVMPNSPPGLTAQNRTEIVPETDDIFF